MLINVFGTAALNVSVHFVTTLQKSDAFRTNRLCFVKENICEFLRKYPRIFVENICEFLKKIATDV
jgi:hypothetical protein